MTLLYCLDIFNRYVAGLLFASIGLGVSLRILIYTIDKSIQLFGLRDVFRDAVCKKVEQRRAARNAKEQP